MGYADGLSRLAADNEKGSSWDPRLSEMIGKFRKQLRHLSRLTDDLLDVARLQTGKFSLERRPVRLVEVINHAVEQVQMFGVEQKFDVRTAPGPLVVPGDEERLVQVIHNLLLNAVKHAPGSQVIEVGLSSIADASALIRSGITGPESMSELRTFSAASTSKRKSGGRGLSLRLCLAKDHRAAWSTISVRSIPGDGPPSASDCLFVSSRKLRETPSTMGTFVAEFFPSFAVTGGQ
jgi:signal transduction histidine kinase